MDRLIERCSRGYVRVCLDCDLGLLFFFLCISGLHVLRSSTDTPFLSCLGWALAQ